MLGLGPAKAMASIFSGLVNIKGKCAWKKFCKYWDRVPVNTKSCLPDSLPDTVVKAESVNSFKGRLDRYWNDQEVKYNWKVDIKGTGSRSNVV